MPELATRYPCPVCLGVMMDKVRIGTDAPLEIDHCGRCGGVWFDAGEVDRLRRFPSAVLWSRIARRDEAVAMPCHSCHAPFYRELEKCPSCGWKNQLDCPVCDKRMKRRNLGVVTLDVCAGCKGVWFDHAELLAVWDSAVLAVAPNPAGTRGGDRVSGGVDLVANGALDVVWYAPNLAVHAVSGAAHAASHIPDAVAAAPELAVTVVSAAGDAAGGIFEAIAAILEAIFGLFDG